MTDEKRDECEAVRCDCCEMVLPIGTPAKVDRESGAIICLDCFDALEPLS